MTIMLEKTNSNSMADSSAGPSKDEVTQLISSLKSLWEPHHEKGLQIRHETGQHLNDSLGNPGDRQEYGAGTCKEVAAEIKVSVSELSRMRNFAFRYPDFDDFQSQHSECNRV